MLCPICAGSVQEFCATRSVLLQLGALRGSAGQRAGGSGPLGPLAQLAPLGKERRRKGQQGKGGRVDRGWQGVGSPAGFKRAIREGPTDTAKAPVFLMNLHNRNVAEW